MAISKAKLFLVTVALCMGHCSTEENNNTTSPLAKFVLLFSRPGAFVREAQAAFGTDVNVESQCPSGDEGLDCRRMEARRGAYECAADELCSSCKECDETRAVDWPRCCKKHFLCCSRLAAACQKCDHPELSGFCAKRFKRCF